MRYAITVLIAGTLAALAGAQTTPTSDPSPQIRAVQPAPFPATGEPAKFPAGYQAVVLPANMAATAATRSPDKVEVVGQPRMTQGHPCTLWDQEDIAHYQQMLKTSPRLQEQFAALRAGMDQRITEPLGVPEPKKGPDGKWLFLGDQEPYKAKGGGGARAYWGQNFKLSRDLVDLGLVYALTGEAKYGEYGKKILLAYAERYPHFGFPPGAPNHGSARDGRLTAAYLGDSFWFIPTAFGYDLIYNLPSWTPPERALIHDNLFQPIVDNFRSERFKGIPYLNDPTNRSANYAAGALIAGYATEDAGIIRDALYGVGGSKEKPEGGVYGTFFAPQCLTPDGLWAESVGYQISIAGASLVDLAEILWHHGIDMYRFNNGVFKRIFDSPLQFAYPDAEMTLPCVGDTGNRLPIAESGDAVIYEYAYRRYADPRYLAIINAGKQSLQLTSHQGPPSVLYDLDARRGGAALAQQAESINFFDNGIGVQRLPAGGGIVQLILLSGPSRSHGQPDKMTLDLFALGDVVAPVGGVIYPYDDPLDARWYDTTLSHCALTVDEKSEVCYITMPKYKGAPVPTAPQLVFGPAATMAIQRAYTNSHYAGVTLDRALFLTPEYVADIFGAFSQGTHTYDLAWHLRGQLICDLPFQPMTFPEPVANGYNALSEVRRAGTDQAWSATFTRNGKEVRLLAAGGNETEIITGKGHYRGSIGYHQPDEMPPTILERRTKSSATLYGNAVDISGRKDGYVKTVTQEGGLEAGYGLLKVETVKGTDLCFSAYRPGTYKAGGLETDGQQALILTDGAAVRAMYLAGGKLLKTAGATIKRSEPGLAYVEKLANGTYVVGNPSPSDATVTVTLPGVAEAGPFTAQLKAGSKVALAAKRR